jgi:hypothetical protein
VVPQAVARKTRDSGRSAPPTASELGRAAAERLSDDWPDVSWVPHAPTETWANAAINRFTELIGEQRAIFRASQRGAERGAASLSPRPFQGIIEALQNADDLAAGELRIAVRSRGRRRELLMVHDGDRVRLDHVGAMVLPWLTTKQDDPDASGRFGIGQKTLRALGGPLEVHCAPFQFRVEPKGPVVSDPVSAIKGFYAPTKHETLFVVPLLPSVKIDELRAFVADELGPKTLLFLRSVRRISFVELPSGNRIVDHRLIDGERTTVRLQVGSRKLAAERLELREPRSRRRYGRYLVERPLSRDEQRHEKATGPTTPIGIVVPLSRAEVGGFYDRLPLPLPCGFSFSLNAQFDPDAARSTLLQNDWNRRRIEDLGHLLASVALDASARDPGSAWRAVPLADEVAAEAGSWFAARLRESVLAVAQARLAEQLKLEAHGRRRRLQQLVYEDEELDGLLTREDQEHLSPGRFAVVPDFRDADGRWRRVLRELGRSKSIEVEEALELFDQADDELGAREPSWYVAMARAAIDADLFSDFLHKQSVLLADGRRVESPGGSDPRSLVRRVDPNSLAAALDVAQQVHPAYLADDADARVVAETLTEWDILIDECDSADGVLRVLARDYSKNTIGRVRVDDAQLILLRDAFERLSEDEQKALGARVGQNIELRAFVYDGEGGRSQEWISPAEAYLPSAIDRETDSFARAAAETTDIRWLDAGYAKLLKREGGRRELGAQKFLARLGAGTAPRLQRPDNEASRWKRDPRPASKIDNVWPSRPQLQMLEITALSPRPTYLLNDRWSPDLDAVIENICEDQDDERQQRRGLALLGVLARSWDRLYVDHQHAQAVYHYDGYWNNPRDVIATWLARAASEAWLPSADGTMNEPAELCLPTEANRLVYADSGSRFLADVDEEVLRSPALAALRLRRGPSARSLVERLLELREQPTSSEVASEVRTAYKLLALACPPEGMRRPVDDMSVADLRTEFAGGRRRRGLILVDGRWYPPKDVFAGEAIFGHRRPFAPAGSAYMPLWQTIGLREPAASDCVAVLRELARRPLAEEDRAVALAATRALAQRVEELSPQARTQLGKLPLWTGEQWRSARPIFGVEDAELAEQVAGQVAVWQSEFVSYGELDGLLGALNVTLLRPEQFEPVSLDGRGAISGDDLRHRFALAVEHLRDELFRGDKSLFDSLAVRWRDLAAAHVIVAPNLKLKADLEAKRIVVEAGAHLRREPLTFIARSSDDAGSAEAGGRAIASLFAGDRQKVAWAWASMWQRAGDNVAPERIVLADDEAEDDAGTERLIDLQGQAKERRRRRHRHGAKPKTAGGAANGNGDVDVKQLKDLAEFDPDDGAIVNAGVSVSGIIFPLATTGSVAAGGAGATNGRGSTGIGSRSGTGGGDGNGAGRGVQSVLPPLDARERLALDAVKEALRLDPPQVVDLRKRRGIGADMVDELRQHYELKMSSSAEFPSEVTLTRSEVDRAQNDPDFFLALVAGLEDAAGELRVRFIFNPLARLGVRIKGEVTLSGLREVEALEYRFSNVAEGEPSHAVPND